MENDKETVNVSTNETDIRSKLRIYRFSVLAVALLAGVLRTAALFTSYDKGIGYFNHNNILPATVTALLIIGSLWALSAAFLIRPEELPSAPKFNTNGVFFSSIYAGFIMLADFGYKIFQFFQLRKSGEINWILEKFRRLQEYTSAVDRSDRIIAVISVIGTAAALLSAIFFFVRASAKTAAKGHVILGMFVIIRALCGIALIYFDMDIPMNNPNKIILQIALMSAMLYFLTEERFLIGGGSEKPRAFMALALVSVILTASAGISCVIAFFAGVVSVGTFCVEGLICIIFFLYIYAHFSAYEKALAAPEGADAKELTEENALPDGEEKKKEETEENEVQAEDDETSESEIVKGNDGKTGNTD
ncbi:MAG: hypothetical protein MJ102_00900 [Clostridia bacterium]|nr:hypothetical protein [Clostridia bacterium]